MGGGGAGSGGLTWPTIDRWAAPIELLSALLRVRLEERSRSLLRTRNDEEGRFEGARMPRLVCITGYTGLG